LPSRPFAILAALAAALLIVLGLAQGVQAERGAPTSGPTDLGLYAFAVRAAEHPATWYRDVVAEQRREGYELKPFVTVRPPALSFLLAALRTDTLRRAALAGLALLSLALWRARFEADGAAPLAQALGLAVLVTGVLAAGSPQAPYMHEAWAGLLMSAALALRRPERFGLAVLAALAAALIRELAAPVLLVMAALAALEGRRREALAWTAALAGFALALALHGWAVTALTLPGDARSPGWVKLSGWPFVLHAAQWNAVLASGPAWLTPMLVPLALLAAILRRDDLGRRLAVVLTGYAAAFAVIGRPENFYWGLMLAPLLPAGLARAAAGVRPARARGPADLAPGTART
jgi:hypothetical protein